MTFCGELRTNYSGTDGLTLISHADTIFPDDHPLVELINDPFVAISISGAGAGACSGPLRDGEWHSFCAAISTTHVAVRVSVNSN